MATLNGLAGRVVARWPPVVAREPPVAHPCFRIFFLHKHCHVVLHKDCQCCNFNAVFYVACVVCFLLES